MIAARIGKSSPTRAAVRASAAVSFGKHEPAPPRSGMQEVEADPRVVAHAERDLAHVGVHRLAQVGDRVHERHLRREERVRRVLDHFSGGGTRDEHRTLHVAVEVRDAHRDRGIVGADHDPGRRQEVADRGSSRRNSGFDATPTSGTAPEARRSRPTCPLEPTGIVDLFTSTAPAGRTRRELVHDGLDDGQVGVAVGALGGRDAQEDELGVGRGRRGADDEAQPAGGEPFGDELGEALLEHVDVALREASDLVGVDVSDDDLVAEVGQARARRQPDVAGADDADAAHGRGLTGRSPSLPPHRTATGPRRCRSPSRRCRRRCPARSARSPVVCRGSGRSSPSRRRSGS